VFPHKVGHAHLVLRHTVVFIAWSHINHHSPKVSFFNKPGPSSPSAPMPENIMEGFFCPWSSERLCRKFIDGMRKPAGLACMSRSPLLRMAAFVAGITYIWLASTACCLYGTHRYQVQFEQARATCFLIGSSVQAQKLIRRRRQASRKTDGSRAIAEPPMAG